MSEACPAAAAQYRYYAEGYQSGALWEPGSKVAPKNYGDKPQGAIFDYYTMHQYFEGTKIMPPIVTQFLIRTAYKNYLSGHSLSFGQAYVLTSCLGLVNREIDDVYRCDQNVQDVESLNLKQFVQCANSKN